MCYNTWGAIKSWSVCLCSFESPVDMTTYLDHNIFTVFHFCIYGTCSFSLSMDAAYCSLLLVCLINTLLLFPLSHSLPPLIFLCPSASSPPCSFPFLILLSYSHPHHLLLYFSLFLTFFSHLSFLTCPCVLTRSSSILPLSPQVDSMDNFTPSNTPSREDDPKSHLKSRSRSPSMASDMEPIEVRQSLSVRRCLTLVRWNFPSYHQLEILIEIFFI